MANDGAAGIVQRTIGLAARALGTLLRWMGILSYFAAPACLANEGLHWLKFGVWHPRPFSIMITQWAPTGACAAWLKNPRSYLGLHQIVAAAPLYLGIIPLSLAAGFALILLGQIAYNAGEACRKTTVAPEA